MGSGFTVWQSSAFSLLLLLAGGLALATLTGPSTADTITVTSPSSAPLHLLVHSTPPSPDSIYELSASATSIALADRGGSGEVIFFPEDPELSLTVLPVSEWGDGESTHHSATINSSVQIKLAFWLVCPADSLQSWRARCESQMVSTMAMWNQEGAGLTVGKYMINGVPITSGTDPSTIPALPPALVESYANFTCGKAEGLVKAVMNLAGSPSPAANPLSGFISAFYVQNVDGRPYAGEACVGSLPGNANNAVFLGCTVSPMLLAHELGHLFLLQHTFPKSTGTNAYDGIDWKNLNFTTKGLMYGKIKTNATITEGQIVRLLLESTSVLNRDYGYHRNTPRHSAVGLRNCSNTMFGNQSVPRLDFRIRPD